MDKYPPAKHVQNLYPMFWDKSRELIAAIIASKGESHNSEADESICVEVNRWASRATLDIIGQGGFGQSFNAIQDPDNAISRTYRSLFRPDWRGQILGVLGFLLPVRVVELLPFLRNDQMKQTSEFIRRVCQDAIDAKRQKPKSDMEGERDILSVAMDSGVFSDEELVDQMMTFLAAGHETSASAVTWAIYLLAKHPNIQSRLRDELTQSPLPHPSDDSISAPVVTADTIEKLTYLNAVCREVLRLFPPVSITIRVAVRDTSICDQPIPQGTTIMIPPWAVNASPALWGDDAGIFNPERWLVANEKAALGDSKGGGGGGTNYNFLTFLHGPRSCIGQTFAVGELKCLVAAWVGAFDTGLKDPEFVPVVKGGITAKPKDGLHVRVRPVGAS
ncbi:MAG: hypothetical protein Q9202_002333 [Teloschistes flavicans]